MIERSNKTPEQHEADRLVSETILSVGESLIPDSPVLGYNSCAELIHISGVAVATAYDSCHDVYLDSTYEMVQVSADIYARRKAAQEVVLFEEEKAEVSLNLMVELHKVEGESAGRLSADTSSR